jgi:hypothetical protein
MFSHLLSSEAETDAKKILSGFLERLGHSRRVVHIYIFFRKHIHLHRADRMTY